MSYNGKKPVFKDVITEKTKYKNLTEMPIVPESNYYQIYFRFGRPYFMTETGAETALIQDTALSVSLPVQDYVYIQEPTYLFENGEISYKPYMINFDSRSTDFTNSVLSTGTGEADKILTTGYFTDYFFPNMCTLIKDTNNNLFGFEHNTAQAVNLFITSDIASCCVNQLNMQVKHVVYHRQGKLYYSLFSRNFSKLTDEQEILTVNNIRYLQCISYTLKNDLTDDETDQEFAIVYIDDTGLQLSLFKYREGGILWPSGRIDTYYKEEALDPYYLERVKAISALELLDSKNAGVVDGDVKHIHIGRTEDNAICKIVPVLEYNNTLTDYNFEVIDIAPEPHTVTFTGSNVSLYPSDALYMGSLGMLSGRDGRYYIKDNIIYLPIGSIDLSGDGIVKGINHIAKYENITVFFNDRTVEITAMPNNGFFSSRTTLENNFLMPNGSNFTYSGIFDPDNYVGNKYNTIRSLIIYTDNDSRFATRTLNNIDNIINDKPTPNTINTFDSNISNRFIKPLNNKTLIISGEEENKAREYNYTTDTLSEYALTIQGVTTGVVPYVLPVRFATNVYRYIVISQLQTNNEFVTLDARTSSTHGIPASPVAPATNFNLEEQFNISDLLLLQDNTFLMKNSDSSIFFFKWHESNDTFTQEHKLTKADFNNNDIKYIANGHDGKIVVATRSGDGLNIKFYSVDSSYAVVELYSLDFAAQAKCFAFSYESGIMCLAGDVSNQYIVVYNNDLLLLNEFNYPGLIHSTFFNHAEQGFNCSTLKDIRAANYRYTFIYNHETRTPTLDRRNSLPQNITQVKHDSPIMPATNQKPIKLLSRAFFEASGDYSNVLIDYTLDDTDISATESFYPSATVSDIRIFDFATLSDDKTIFAYIDIEDNLKYSIIQNGVIISTEDLGVQQDVIEVKAFCAYNDEVSLLLRRANQVNLINSVENIELSLNETKKIDVATFNTSVAVFILNNFGQLKAHTFIFNDDNTIIHKEDINYKINIEDFMLAKSRSHFATILLNTMTNSTLESFIINEFWSIEQSTQLPFIASKNTIANLEGIVTNGDNKQFYRINDEGKFVLLQSPEGEISLGEKTVNWQNMVVTNRGERLFLYEFKTNESTPRGFIRFGNMHTFKGFTISETGIITALTNINVNWYVHQYRLYVDSTSGVYIGVAQETNHNPFGAVTALKGGLSVVHENLPISQKVWSSDGTVELGLALTAGQILLSPCDIEKVGQPLNISPNNYLIINEKPTTLEASPAGISLYMRDIIKRHWRVATDKFFKNVVYTATEEPHITNHTFTDVDWIEEKRVYYWQCQDENDLGFKSSWSRPYSFSVSLAEEVAKPIITSPTEDQTLDLIFAITATAFAADPDQNHVSSDWEIYEGDTLVWSSYDNLTNLTSLNVNAAVGLESDKAYKIRVRYKGDITGNSPYSDFVNIRTKDDAGLLVVTTEDFPFLYIYRQDIDTFTLDTSNYSIDYVCTKAAVRRDKNYIAIGHRGGSNLTVLRNIPNGWYNMPLSQIPTSDVNAVTIYEDYIVAGTSAGLLKLYRIEENTVQLVSGAFGTQVGNITGARFSFNGDYLSVTTRTAPYLHVYRRDGEVFNELTIDVPPNNICEESAVGGLALPNSTEGYIVVATQSSPFLLYYKVDGNTVTQESKINDLPISSVRSLDTTVTGSRFSIALAAFPYLVSYEQDTSGEFNALPILSSPPSGGGRAIRYNDTGLYITLGTTVSPHIEIFKNEGGNYVKIASPDVEPDSSVNGIGYQT